MTFKYFHNVPLEVITKGEGAKKGDIGICHGGCNCMKSIENTTYQLCNTCVNKWRYYGYECDVPSCELVADGSRFFKVRKDKIMCESCYQHWGRMDFCIWERFVEKRHLRLLRPKQYVRALEEGIITPVEKENRVQNKEVAECHHCYKEKTIHSTQYQLCSSCCSYLQYHGETCGVCGIRDAYGYNEEESLFVCVTCQATKNKYSIASYHIYKTQIRTIKNCQFCNDPVSHDKENGESRCSACIDHDHETGITRGVLCQDCNKKEGAVKEWAKHLNTDLLGVIESLQDYLKNPPLDQSWTQDRDSFR